MDLGFVSLNTPRDIAPGALGQELESRGFESIWVGEHPQIPVSARDQFPPVCWRLRSGCGTRCSPS